MRTIALPTWRTFQERIYLSVPHGWKQIELTVDVWGSIDPPDNSVGYGSPLPEIDGLEVVSVNIEGQEMPPHLVDWVDSEFNRRFWFGEIPEGSLEEMVSEQLQGD